jgi:TonB-dependent receptor
MRALTYKINLLLFGLFLFPAFLWAQKAVLAGKIIDKETGETLIGATVALYQGESQVTGNVSDIDGSYVLDADPGVYRIEFSYAGYAKIVVESFEVKAGAANTLDAALETETLELDVVVVTATTMKNTDASLISLQRKAFSIQDGVSSQQISRTGSSNAADAMRQMTGALVEGGRFVVMRGLGDRYSISQLNGMTLPSTDPYRNSASLDLIPSQMIENIVTVKTFTPELPGNFSGGLVNVNTKSFPEKFTLFFQAGSEYNTQSSRIDDFNTMKPLQGDWLGLNASKRDQPGFLKEMSFGELSNLLGSSNYLAARNPNPANNSVREIFHRTARELSNEFVPEQRTTPLNSSISFSIGNRVKFFGNDLGFTLGVNYSQNFQHYGDGSVGAFRYNNPEFLEEVINLQETKSTRNPQLGALFNVNYKLSENHVVGANVIFNNDAESASRVQAGRYPANLSDPAATFNVRTLEYIQRQFTSYQLTGRHLFGGNQKTEVEWLAGKTNSLQMEPDLRYFAYSFLEQPGEDAFYNINNAEFPFPFHFFRDLRDEAYQGKLDITIPFLTNGKKGSGNRIKLGGQFNRTERTFDEYSYQMFNTAIPSELRFNNFQGDFNGFFNYRNFGLIDTLYNNAGQVSNYVTGYYYINGSNLKNFYTGSEQVAAAYLMGIVNLTPNLKVVGGLRYETTQLNVEAGDGTTGNIDLGDLLYSLNAIYALSDKSNLRLAATKTLARPNLRELAPFEQFDTKNGFFNVGNTQLKRTLIQNFDLRYELYPRTGELIALSGFYKNFSDPILRQFNPRATTPELRFINIPEALVYGAELELRKQLDIFGPAFRSFYFSSNFALIYSSYDIPEEELAASRAISPAYDRTSRPFQGQAPYIVNLILSYIEPENGWEASLAYNVTGERLYSISLFATPDVYEKPFPLLNFKVSKRFGKHYQASFNARNLLNSVNRRVLEFNGRTYDAESLTIGSGFGFSLSYWIK